jgi:outer membrane protein OmpA-like peptidoglycan-associated protein
MGGYDVFRSTRRNGGWTNPVGIPYAFNTSLENTFFILNNNAPGFITSIYNEKTKSRNIYAIVAENPADKITIAGGTVTLQDGMNVDPKQTRIILADIKKATDLKTIQLIDTSSYKFEVKPGDYQLFVSHEGYKTDTININVPLYFSGNYISVNASLMPDKVFEGAFLSIKNILFEFNSYKLDNEALTTLENLKSILISYPELKIEVAGYTDAKGASSYNKRLANSRAEAVIRHLTESGISGSRFVKKAFGESNFAALNTNRDGTDNPEGRKYNRRASFGIVDPQTGVIIRQESYTPEHLRQPLSMRYSIVLLKTKDWLKPDYFSGLINNDQLFVRTIKVDSLSMYVLGVFYNKTDALKYLDFVRKKGLDKAYILNQYELANVTKAGRTKEANKGEVDKSDQKVYTIQLKAAKSPLDMNQIFNGLDGVNEIKASDGLYKYYYGEYQALSKAKERLESIKKLGFNDAFIRNLTIMIFQ